MIQINSNRKVIFYMYKQYSNTFGLVKYIYDGTIIKRKVLRFFCGSVYNYTKALPRPCMLFDVKTCTSYTDEVGLKVPSFQKFTLFLQYKIFHRDVIRLHLYLPEDVTD